MGTLVAAPSEQDQFITGISASEVSRTCIIQAVLVGDRLAGLDAQQNVVSVKIDGGNQIDVTLTTQAAGTSKGQIVKELNADATFGAAATASLDGNQIVIKSKANSSCSSVEVVTTALNTALGLTAGTTTAAAASTGAALNVQNQGAGTLTAKSGCIQAI